MNQKSVKFYKMDCSLPCQHVRLIICLYFYILIFEFGGLFHSVSKLNYLNHNFEIILVISECEIGLILNSCFCFMFLLKIIVLLNLL